MEKLNRFVAKNAWFCYVSGCLCAFFALLLLAEWMGIPQILVFPGTLVVAFVLAVVVFSRANDLLKPTLRQLMQECDPYPMLEETREQLHYPGPRHFVIARKMNYALALQYTGQYDEAYEIISGIPIESLPASQAALKVTYYNNLMSFYMGKDCFAEAEAAYENMLRSYNAIKNNTQKAAMCPMVEGKKAALHFCRQEYELALALSESDQQDPLTQVGYGFFRAKIYLAMGDMENAETELEYVVRHGNRLHYVTEAKALLKKINTEE